MINECLGRPFGVGDSLRKDTREVEQICLSPYLLAVIKITHRVPTWLCSLLCVISNKESCIISGDNTTQYFHLERGAHQGDPISA